jgi:hypothetical protein
MWETNCFAKSGILIVGTSHRVSLISSQACSSLMLYSNILNGTQMKEDWDLWCNKKNVGVHPCGQMCPFGGAFIVSHLTGRILIYGSIQMITGYWLLLPGFASSWFSATGYHHSSQYIQIAISYGWGGGCVYVNICSSISFYAVLMTNIFSMRRKRKLKFAVYT